MYTSTNLLQGAHAHTRSRSLMRCLSRILCVQPLTCILWMLILLVVPTWMCASETLPARPHCSVRAHRRAYSSGHCLVRGTKRKGNDKVQAAELVYVRESLPAKPHCSVRGTPAGVLKRTLLNMTPPRRSGLAKRTPHCALVEAA